MHFHFTQLSRGARCSRLWSQKLWERTFSFHFFFHCCCILHFLQAIACDCKFSFFLSVMPPAPIHNSLIGLIRGGVCFNVFKERRQRTSTMTDLTFRIQDMWVRCCRADVTCCHKITPHRCVLVSRLDANQPAIEKLVSCSFSPVLFLLLFHWQLTN